MDFARIVKFLMTAWAGLVAFHASAEEPWQAALAKMPLRAPTMELNRTNCVPTMLQAFAATEVVKGLVFMPGATDEFYMFRRARAHLTNAAPTLMDAVMALTNQTLIRAHFLPPLLLLHTEEDPLEPIIAFSDSSLAGKWQAKPLGLRLVANDRDWGYMQPLLKSALKAEVLPWKNSYDAWHFYRHSLAGSGLTAFELLEAVTLAGKSKVTVRPPFLPLVGRPKVLFECDTRVRSTPKISEFPR